MQQKFVNWIVKASIIASEVESGKKRKLSEQSEDPNAKKMKVDQDVKEESIKEQSNKEQTDTSPGTSRLQDLLGDILR